ncbi:hypothetical protein [Paenibacillus donghaensis]|uniref:Uncharacterized protein n=1 Tax=Paenibacillus donghaensis TaxID=414771 RepID=A0A2Z2KVE3_9BACL|nr:hypothetical protein [Paenibacillus donghaensis]ASA25211.1 hypothetical protein B9T62_33450 [Paenibacillus donghaensis]
MQHVNYGVLNHRELLVQKLQSLESRYDSGLRLLRSPFSSPGYHTTIKQAEFIHSTRDSLSYALGLLDSEQAAYEQRAFDIIAAVVSLQDRDRSSVTFGLWSWFYEEPLAEMAPPDWNWADFCGSRLIQALSRHGARFPLELREAASQAVEYACEAIMKRDVGPHYTNIAILGALVTRLAGEQLGLEHFAQYGLERLAKLYDYTRERGAFQEYNSPVYTAIAVVELSKLRAETTDSRVGELCDALLGMTWKTVAEHYHPATGQWSGPHSRSYRSLLDEQAQAFLQVATEGQVMFFPWDQLPYEEEWYRSGISCPPAYLELFTLPGQRELKQLYEGGAGTGSGKWAAAYLTPSYSLGSFTDSDFWNQRRPLLAYVDNGGAPAYLRLRCLHEGYDYCSARFHSQQQQGQVLFGIDFVTDGGDTHPNLDRIDGTIRASDFRLRLEIGGHLDGIRVETAREAAGSPAYGVGNEYGAADESKGNMLSVSREYRECNNGGRESKYSVNDGYGHCGEESKVKENGVNDGYSPCGDNDNGSKYSVNDAHGRCGEESKVKENGVNEGCSPCDDSDKGSKYSVNDAHGRCFEESKVKENGVNEGYSPCGDNDNGSKYSVNDAHGRCGEESKVIEIGEVVFRLRTWFAAFDELAASSATTGSDQPLTWEIHRSADTFEIDLILYSGPERTLDFRQLSRAAVICTLAAEGSAAEESAPLLKFSDSGLVSVSLPGRETEAFELSLRPRVAE